jgi:SAM-dependent methyltransferase
MVNKETVRRGYDTVAPAYAAQRTADGREAEILDAFLDHVPDGGRVLDAGCGQGVPVLRRLAGRAEEANTGTGAGAAAPVGVDLSREQLAAPPRPPLAPTSHRRTSLRCRSRTGPSTPSPPSTR